MQYFLKELVFEDEVYDFLNQEGTMVLENLYQYSESHIRLSVSDSEEARNLIDCYTEYYGLEQSCM